MTDHLGDKLGASIPHFVWSARWLAQHEALAARSQGINLYTLMQRAGQAAFALSRQYYPTAGHYLVVCGKGNNGGDGYIVATHCLAAGIRVTLIASDAEHSLPDSASQAKQAWLDAGGVVHGAQHPWPDDIDLIIDGVLGTGLRGAPERAIAELITRINQYPAPVIALDIPSGLLAETGAVEGEAVQAQHTLAFIGLKLGLLTGKARDFTGQLHCAALGLEPWLATQAALCSRYDAHQLPQWIKARKPTSHKGHHGKLLVIGGDQGTAGAVRLTAEGALRSGAGLVRVLTRPENIAPIISARPELMIQTLTPESLNEGIAWADVIAIGPGLGQSAWGQQAVDYVKKSNKPMLWDADALNLLAIAPDIRHNRIITPHPGEAARLLHCSIEDIERDRFLAVTRLVERYGGVALLKGAGTLVADSHAQAVIDVGNAGMASGGMGDVLSGIISGLLAEGLTLYDAACAGGVAHGAAADVIAQKTGTRGMLASDLFSTLYPFVNPDLIT